VDLTPFVQSSCGSSSSSEENCGWQVPQGARLRDSSEVFSMTSFIPSARGDQPHSSIMWLIFMGTEAAHDGSAGETRPWARQCALSACLQTLETRVENGVLTEKVTDTKINTTVLDNSNLDDGQDHNVYVISNKNGTNSNNKGGNDNDNGNRGGKKEGEGEGEAKKYMLGIEAMLGMRGWFSQVFANGSASRSSASYNRTITNNAVVVNLTVGISSGETFFDSDIVTAFYWNYYEYENGLDMLINDLATSMTVAFRSFNGAEPVAGRATHAESYVHVRWGFAIVPILVVVGAALFLLAAIFRSESKSVEVWKSSALAMLFHGLDDGTKFLFARDRTLKEKKGLAKSVKVQLEESDDGILLRI